MGGSRESALKGVETKKAKYGLDYMAVIAAKGGRGRKGSHHSEETKRKISETKKKAKKEE